MAGILATVANFSTTDLELKGTAKTAETFDFFASMAFKATAPADGATLEFPRHCQTT